jgi:signal transduction histidine kinase/ActR/RegA family two-component response regulator/type II secretory pathway pseudopilin PulG
MKIIKRENINIALATIAGMVTILIGLLAIFGEQFDIKFLKAILNSNAPIQANTAAAFILTGLALLILQRSFSYSKMLVRILVVTVVLFSLISLIEYFFLLDFGIDHILVPLPDNEAALIATGRLPLYTSINFILVGFALILLTIPNFKKRFLLELVIIFSLSISVIIFLGYVTNLNELLTYGTAKKFEMVFGTSITFIILCLGLILTAYTQQQSPVTIEQKFFVGAMTSIIVLVFISILTVSSLRSLSESANLVENKTEVKEQISNLLTAIINIETGVRGYVITGSEEYLEPMEKSIKEISEQLKELRNQIKDNPAQQNSLNILSPLIEKRMAVAKQIFSIRKLKGLSEAISLFDDGEGKMLSDSIRAVTSKMIYVEEYSLMQIELEAIKNKAAQTQTIVIAGFLFQVFLFGLMFVVVKRNSAKRKEAEEALLKLNKNLHLEIEERQLAQVETQKAKAEAERANVAKSEFLSRMSHELRTPMNSILGFAQLMDMGELDPAHKKGVKFILKSGKHLLELINEVLDIARIEAGRMTISTEPVEIDSIVKETIDIVRHLAEDNQISLVSDDPITNNLYVKADHQRLKQVLLNLITNAVKYNRKGGSVKVESIIQNSELKLEQSANSIRICITDTGNGITQADIEKLFKPFERIGAERAETEGTGLGLTISKKLVEAMGGKIGIKSEVGKGSTFWIELPRTESQKEHYERTNELTKTEIERTASNKTILYIEDNLLNLHLVEQILEMHRPSIKLITNMYGKNAVQFAIDYNPDLILLDLDLPDIHGSEVIKLLQEEPRTSKIPVIILSADAMTKQIKQLMEAGAKNYLIKPIDVVQFLKAVDEWIRISST